MNFLDYTFLDNSVRSLVGVFVIILLVSLFRKWLSRPFASLLYIPIKNKWKSVEKKEFHGLILKPLGWFLAVVISIILIDNLVFPKEWIFNLYGIPFNIVLHRIGNCIVSILIIWVIQSIIDFIALVLEINVKETPDKRDDQIIVFFRDFFKAIVYFLGILLILKTGFSLNVGAFLTGLSIVGAALALAAKESIENLIASFVIFFDKPFFTGDTVKVNAVIGTIEHIGLRSTRIRTMEQTLITVPNKQMVDSIVDNWNKRTGRKCEFKIDFDISNTTVQIENFISKTKLFLDENKTNLKSNSVFITDFNKNAITVTVECITIPFSIDAYHVFKQECSIFLKETIESNQLKMANQNQEIKIFNADAGNAPVDSQII
jgi:MscS family membrane protein